MRLWLLLVAVGMTITWRAAAAEVVLVHPAGADPFIEEIFHRVRGELRVHAISFEQAEGAPGETSEVERQRLLDRAHATACVLFAWKGDTSVVEVWVGQGSTKPPALLQAVQLQRNAEVPTLLAARAVDLLLETLGRPQHSAPAVPPPAPPVPNAARPPTRSAAPPIVGPWSVGAGAAMLGADSVWGAAWGPRLFVDRSVAPRLTLGVRVEGPLSGAENENSKASARLVQGLGLVELGVTLARPGPFTFGISAGAGAHFLRATGAIADGIGSLAANQVGHWSLAAEAGLTGSVALSARFAILLSAEALLLAPQPLVSVGGVDVGLDEPALDLCAGIRFSL